MHDDSHAYNLCEILAKDPVAAEKTPFNFARVKNKGKILNVFECCEVGGILDGVQLKFPFKSHFGLIVV
jgi:hypothetical protein